MDLNKNCCEVSGSINHVQALASKEEVVVHGHVHEHIRHVHETRCTGFFIHLLRRRAENEQEARNQNEFNCEMPGGPFDNSQAVSGRKIHAFRREWTGFDGMSHKM